MIADHYNRPRSLTELPINKHKSTSDVDTWELKLLDGQLDNFMTKWLTRKSYKTQKRMVDTYA